MSQVTEVLPTSTERPSFDPTACINRRQRRFTCTVCTELCPAKVFSLDAREAMKWNRCTDCGICAAQCPTRCFALSPSGQRRLTEDVDLKRPISFACGKETELGDITVRCLAAAPWELLAVYAMHTKLIVYIGACENCEHALWAGLVQEQLRLLRDFLGEERWRAQVQVLTEKPPEEQEETEPEKSVTRREMFAGITRSVTKNLYKAAAARLPLLADYDPDGMQYRRLLAQAAAGERKRVQTAIQEGHEEKLPDYGVSLPRFTARCFGCGICEKLCPQKAIEIGSETDGKRMIYLTPWKCSGCGLCQKACPHSGISELHTVRVPYLKRVPLVRVNSASCERCGVAIPLGSEPKFCPACKVKVKK